MASNLEAVDLDGMKQSAGVHLQTLENHRASLSRMKELASRAEQGWKGQAGVTFRSALEAWMGNYAVVGKILDEMHERIIANANSQTAAHTATTSSTGALGMAMETPVTLKGF